MADEKKLGKRVRELERQNTARGALLMLLTVAVMALLMKVYASDG